MKKKNKRSYFRITENRKDIIRRRKLLKYIPKQTKLIQFLIDNEADEGFIKGLQTTTALSRRLSFSSEDEYNSICGSFTWFRTKEGYNYWRDLTHKYNEWFKDNQ